MSTLQRKQGQGFRGAYALWDDLNKTIPINIETRNVEIKLVREEGEKVVLTIPDASITKSVNIAAFTVAGSLTTNYLGKYRVQVCVDGLDVTDKIVSLTPIIIEYSKTY